MLLPAARRAAPLMRDVAKMPACAIQRYSQRRDAVAVRSAPIACVDASASACPSAAVFVTPC